MIRDTVIESRSARSFDESFEITREKLLELIDTARLCPSARNAQPLKYRLVSGKEECELLLAETKWAGAFPDRKFPPDGHRPSAFIVVCCDTSIAPDSNYTYIDAGIATQTIMLTAREEGISGCIIGAFNPDSVSEKLRLPRKYKPLLVLALGKSDEFAILCSVPKSGETIYFRDKADVHYVPKRSLEEVVIDG